MKKEETLFQRQGQIGIFFPPLFFSVFVTLERWNIASVEAAEDAAGFGIGLIRATDAGQRQDGTHPLFALHPPQSLSFDSYCVSSGTGSLVASDKWLVPPLGPSLPVRTHRIYHFVKWLKMVYWCHMNDPGLVILELLAPKDTAKYLLPHFRFAIQHGFQICLQTHAIMYITLQHLFSTAGICNSKSTF